MSNPNKQITGGLEELPIDERDFSLGGVFGESSIKDVPIYGFRTADPINIKDQGGTDLCTAYALTAVSEDQESVELSPYYTFAKTKQIEGNLSAWGANLRDACKSATKYGFIEEEQLPDIFNDIEAERDTIANWENWDGLYDDLARLHRKKSYFKVSGPTDSTFDNIRIALWDHRMDKRSIITGAFWRHEWTSAPAGIISKDYGTGAFGHAFKIFGQKVLGSEIYLMAQLSNGDDIGDGGIFYFPKEVVDKEFKYGAFMFKDMPKKTAEYINGIDGATINDFLLTKFWLWLGKKLSWS